MTEPLEFSPQALGIATLEVVHRILARLIERQIMTDEEATELFAAAAREQALSDQPANKEAGDLLAWIAKERARKFR
jgi:hypothetical protein